MRKSSLIIPIILMLLTACATPGRKEEPRIFPRAADSQTAHLPETESRVEERATIEEGQDTESKMAPEPVPLPEGVPIAEPGSSISAIQIVGSAREGGAGPLTKESVSIGGVRIGDSQEAVRELLGEPTFVQEGGWGTPFIHWHYESYNMYIDFYRTSGTDSAGGVASISVNGPSSLKTDKNIGIGDSLDDILRAYDHVLGTEETDGVMNVHINGSHEEEGFFVPQLHFVLQNDRITHFELTTHLINPDNME